MQFLRWRDGRLRIASSGMNLPAAIECDDALVVFEGPRRIRQGNATGFELWPSPAEAAEVRARIACGRPILVILGGPQAEATALTEQFAGAPPALAQLVHAIARDLAPFSVPALDWLPSDVRDRGLRFLRTSLSYVRRTPPLLRPALCLDDPAGPCPNVRFAHLSLADLETEHLPRVVAYAFAKPSVPL